MSGTNLGREERHEAVGERLLFREDRLHGDKGLFMCISRVIPILCGCFRIQKRDGNHINEYEHFETVENPVQQEFLRQPETFVEIPNHRLTAAEDEAFGDAQDDNFHREESTLRRPQAEPAATATESIKTSLRQEVPGETLEKKEDGVTANEAIDVPPDSPNLMLSLEDEGEDEEDKNDDDMYVQEDILHQEEDEDNNEPREDYVFGGYHTVHCGDVYDNRYTVLKKLGWGVYSTVWLCRDAKSNQKIALKIQKSAPEYTNAAMNEVKILRHIHHQAKIDNTTPNIVGILEHFYVSGVHGNHVCMVFEPLGKTLLDLIQDQGALPISQVKRITQCLLHSLQFIHDRVGILHTDIKPENVLLSASSSDGAISQCTQVKLVDFGTAFYLKDQAVQDIQTREYRCPEAILGILPFQAVADVWSVGCLAFELITGETLFDPQSPRPGEFFSKDESHLAQAIELFGPIPNNLLSRAQHSPKWFNKDKTALRHIQVRASQNPQQSISLVLESNFGISQNEAMETSRFILYLLQYDPLKRPPASAALTHSWLQQQHTV